jgi:hypothetical protein
MLDPNTTTFSEVEDAGTLAIVAQLGATQALTIDATKLAGSDTPRAALIAEAKRVLLITLWKQIYGELGSGLEQIHTHARQVGSLPVLAITRPLRDLLRPDMAVPAPAPETEAVPEKLAGRINSLIDDRDGRIEELEYEAVLLRKVITDCQMLLATWIVPDSGKTDPAVLSELLGILDGPQARAALGS